MRGPGKLAIDLISGTWHKSRGTDRTRTGPAVLLLDSLPAVFEKITRSLGAVTIRRPPNANEQAALRLCKLWE